MALIDKASLLMVPSTYEAGKLYNVLPSGNRAPDQTGENSGYDQTRADFDFDRGSNTAATRVNADGLIEKYRENLLLQSNAFSTSPWSNNDASVTSGQADKDGGTNAWKWKVNLNSSYHYSVQSHTTTNSVCAYSIYAKADGYNFFRLEQGNNGQGAWFNLSSGTIGTTSANTIAKITSVGGDWYRCEISLVTAATTNFLFGFSASETLNYTGDNVSGGFLMFSQLETGLVATDVLTSGATTGKAGVLIDLPRIDYSSGAGALLLEPQRANLITQSEYFDASQWTHYSSTISSNDSTSPDGFENATRWTSTASGTFLTTSLSISDPCNLSVFVKYVDHPYIQLYSGASGGYYANFDIQNNTIGTSGYNTSNEKIESYGNGWYRISCTFANVSAGSTARIGFAQSLTEGWGGLNTSAVGDVLIYGAQLEAGSYPTSYIPNHGESGGVTRAADDCTTDDLQNLNVFNGSQGAVLFEGVKNGEPIFSNFVITANNNTNKSLLVDNSGEGIRLRVFNASSAQDGTITTSAVADGVFKYLIKWNAGALAVYLNGSSVGTNTITAYNYTNANLKEGTFSNNTIKQFTLFDEVPTDAECITLTTL